MSGISELTELISSMSPVLKEGEFVFCSASGSLTEYAHLDPVGTFIEAEGLTLILQAEVAEKAKIPFQSIYKQISLTVHSSLDAVGLTAAIATQLTSYDISANVVAGYYHDHIFVQAEKAALAMQALDELISSGQSSS